MGQGAMMLLAGALGITLAPSAASGAAMQRMVDETEVRAVSAERYSELLRIACFNGFRYRSSDVESGFERQFEEMSLALVDQGYIIFPHAAAPRLVVTEIVMDRRLARDATAEFSCFRAHWSDE